MYTSLFGAYASYVFLTSGSLLAAMTSHFICNLMGVPSIEFTNDQHPLYRFRHGVWLLFAVGAYSFYAISASLTHV